MCLGLEHAPLQSLHHTAFAVAVGVSADRHGCLRSCAHYSVWFLGFFVSLPHRRVGVISGRVGGEECERMGDGGELGVVGGGQISPGECDPGSSHALCLSCADVKFSRLCVLSCIVMALLVCPLYSFCSVLRDFSTCRTLAVPVLYGKWRRRVEQVRYTSSKSHGAA